MSPAKMEDKKGKFIEFLSPEKGYFRETYKSQRINPNFPTPKVTLGIIQFYRDGSSWAEPVLS